MKLIQEITEDIQCLEEATADGKKSLYITGPFMQSEIKNKNGRIYPRSVMENTVTHYINEKVNNKCAYGELGHPQGPKINEDRISHMIEELKWDRNDVIGRAKIFESPMGNIARSIIAGGGRLGVSTRGLGSLKENSKGIMEVQDDFRLSTAADLVTDPSAPAAWVNGIMENVEWLYDESTGSFLPQQSEDYRNKMRKMSTKEIEEKAFSLFESFINNIKQQL